MYIWNWKLCLYLYSVAPVDSLPIIWKFNGVADFFYADRENLLYAINDDNWQTTSTTANLEMWKNADSFGL
jgi:hypothetical protein